MVWPPHDYDSIPGTYVFDGQQASDAYELNRLLFSLNDANNRRAFNENPLAYAQQFDLCEAQQAALVAFDPLALLRMGANIYFLAKAAIPNGVSVQHVGAAFKGISFEAFQQSLHDQADQLEEKLAQAGGYWHG